MVSPTLAGKIVLVTGGSRGIGAACVRLLAHGGADVVLHYNGSRSAAQAVQAGCSDMRVHCVQADLAQPASASVLWRDAVAWQGRVDVLVNNAGVCPLAPQALPDDEWHACWQYTLQVNLLAAADLCREAIPHFQQRGGGIIVNIASRAAFRGDTIDHLPYAASKGGLISLSRTLARGLAKDNILTYTVSPGFVDTEMAAPYCEAFGQEALLRDIPLQRFAAPEEVAAMVAFLASGAVPSATGTNIDINGASYVR